MATSGTYVFTVTRDEIITDALATCGVIDGTETINTSDKTRCTFTLNMILKSIPIDTWLLWCYNDITVPLVSGTSTYTLGPTGTVAGIRPLRVATAWLRNTNISPATDVIVEQLARRDFEMLSPKQTPGIPVNFYYNPTLDNGVLETWPVINMAGYELILSNQRTIQDISAVDGTQNFDLPQEWFLPLSMMLAAEICMKYSLNLQKVQMIKQEAAQWREKMADWSREEPSAYFTPNFQGRGGY